MNVFDTASVILRIHEFVLTLKHKDLKLKLSTPFKIATLAAGSLILVACNKPADQEEKAAAPLNLEDEVTKTSYVIGASAGSAMARNLETLDGTDIGVNMDVLLQAYDEGLNGKSQMDEAQLQAAMNDFRTKVNAVMQEKRDKENAEELRVAEENKEKGATFLAQNKEQEGIVTTDSGLQYKVITEGTGKSPVPSDKVKVHYRGTLIDGTQFDSSYDRGEPAIFGLSQVIRGWTEGLQLMKEGGKTQFFIPADLAYGASPRPTIPGNSVLIFDVELIEIVKTEATPAPAATPAKK